MRLKPLYYNLPAAVCITLRGLYKEVYFSELGVPFVGKCGRNRLLNISTMILCSSFTADKTKSLHVIKVKWGTKA